MLMRKNNRRPKLVYNLWKHQHGRVAGTTGVFCHSCCNVLTQTATFKKRPVFTCCHFMCLWQLEHDMPSHRPSNVQSIILNDVFFLGYVSRFSRPLENFAPTKTVSDLAVSELKVEAKVTLIWKNNSSQGSFIPFPLKKQKTCFQRNRCAKFQRPWGRVFWCSWIGLFLLPPHGPHGQHLSESSVRLLRETTGLNCPPHAAKNFADRTTCCLPRDLCWGLIY